MRRPKRVPGWWVFDEIDGHTDFVLHVLEDFIEMRMSFRFSQCIYQLQKLSACCQQQEFGSDDFDPVLLSHCSRHEQDQLPVCRLAGLLCAEPK